MSKIEWHEHPDDTGIVFGHIGDFIALQIVGWQQNNGNAHYRVRGYLPGYATCECDGSLDEAKRVAEHALYKWLDDVGLMFKTGG